MDPWPFEDEDWKEWEAVSKRYIDAVLAKDDIVCQAISREMYVMMTEWEGKYGEHPWILEHKADFAENREEKLALYGRALERAIEKQRATLTIRIWLADLLLEVFRGPEAALLVLHDGRLEAIELYPEKDWIRLYKETLERVRERMR